MKSGSFVTPESTTATPTLLASIVQTDPIYATFNVSEQDVLRIRADIARRGLTPDDLRRVPVEVGLQSETGYPRTGTLDYASPMVSPDLRALLNQKAETFSLGYVDTTGINPFDIEKAKKLKRIEVRAL